MVERKVPKELSDRISGLDPSYADSAFAKEIILDSTPVPFFGDYRTAKIVTLSINPSSKEFPTERTRLTHLSTIGYETDFFQHEKRINDQVDIEQVHEGMLNYFKSDHWYEKWFKMPEKALNVGLSASYFDNKEQFPIKAFHTDLSPWATKQWKDLDRNTRNSMIAENRTFLQWLISFERYEVILILGSGTTKELPFRNEVIDEIPSSGIVPATFRFGALTLDNGTRKQYFENSFPPSVPISNYLKGMPECYELFGEFIRERYKVSKSIK